MRTAPRLSMLRPAPWLVIAAGAVLIAGCGTMQPPRRATIAQGAEPNNQSTDDSVVRRRVLAAFPIGGPEQGLAEHLQAQGFKVRRVLNVG